MRKLAKRYLKSRLLDTREAAQIANVSTKTIRRWIYAGHVIAFRFHMPQYRVPEISLQEYLQERQHKGK